MSSAFDASQQPLPSHRYQIVDVFNATYGGGNPLGVVLDARGWSDTAMQRFATWTNLVETTFLLPPSEASSADYKVRIFTPHKEIPFAGHPSVGSAHAFLSMIDRATGRATSSVDGVFNEEELQLVQECGAGFLKILVDRCKSSQSIFVQSPICRVIEEQPQEARDLLESILAGQPLGPTPPAFLEGGRKWWLAELASEAAVRAFKLDVPAVEALAAASQSLGLCIFARSSSSSLVVRAFPLGAGIREDPASGAANGLIASYLLMKVIQIAPYCLSLKLYFGLVIHPQEPEGSLSNGYSVSQGREMGKDAKIVVRIQDGCVWVGGTCTTIVDGSIQWPCNC
jgi:PhzF family phenazine biosynthesis protein